LKEASNLKLKVLSYIIFTLRGKTILGEDVPSEIFAVFYINQTI